MPRNVATPEQSARVTSELGRGKGFKNPGKEITVGNETVGNSIKGVRPLRKAERRMLERGEPDIYVYNVSGIFKWSPRICGRDTVTIPTCKPGETISQALIIPGAMVRDYDSGNRFRQTYVEEGIDIVQDILGCSKEMPGLPQNDLTKYGCFYVVGVPFDELEKEEQEKLLYEANELHDQKCREKVLEADQWADNDMTRRWITEPYRLAALHLAERGDKSMLERRWVSKRGKSAPVVECAFCGWEVKKSVAICPNCKNVLNPALFAELQSQMGKAPKSQKQPPASE